MLNTAQPKFTNGNNPLFKHLVPSVEKKLSLSAKNEYAVTNMLQSLSNAGIYCSYFEDKELGFEFQEMIERFKKRVERKINENF